jgi:hypothetical protein
MSSRERYFTIDSLFQVINLGTNRLENPGKFEQLQPIRESK